MIIIWNVYSIVPINKKYQNMCLWNWKQRPPTWLSQFDFILFFWLSFYKAMKYLNSRYAYSKTKHSLMISHVKIDYAFHRPCPNELVINNRECRFPGTSYEYILFLVNHTGKLGPRLYLALWIHITPVIWIVLSLLSLSSLSSFLIFLFYSLLFSLYIYWSMQYRSHTTIFGLVSQCVLIAKDTIATSGHLYVIRLIILS